MFWKRSKANAKIDRVVGEHLELHLYSPVRDEDIFLRTDPRILERRNSKPETLQR